MAGFGCSPREKAVAPYSEQMVLLQTIPGVERIAAWQLIAELGVDMSVFPDAEHCASWVGLSPGSQESAGVPYSGRSKKGNKYPRGGLTQSGWANSHRKDGYLRALFSRIKAKARAKKAVIAVAHVVVIAYSILKTKEPYRELGGDYFDKLNPERTAQRLLVRMAKLGFEVAIKRRPMPAVAPAEAAVAVVEEPVKKSGQTETIATPRKCKA